MADTNTTNQGLLLMEEGTHSNEWGDLTNLNLRRLDVALRGYILINLSAPLTLSATALTTTTSPPEDNSFYRFIEFTGTSSTVTVADVNVVWMIYNNTGGAMTFQPTTGTGLSLPDGKVTTIIRGSDGNNFVDVSELMKVPSTVLLKAGGAMTGAITTNSTFDGRDVAADGVTADAALPKAGGAMTGPITTNSTFDGRDVAADGVTADAALPKAGGAISGNVTNTATGSFQVPQGTTAQRDAGTATGRLRYNSTEQAYEGYTDAGWDDIGGGGPSLGTDSVIRTNAQTISENITFAGTENGSSVGPITVADTFTVTVTSGSTWVIL
jgi:hypothetical protein